MVASQSSYCIIPHPGLAVIRQQLLHIASANNQQVYTAQQEPFSNHAEQVLAILSQLNLDATTLEAALLFGLSTKQRQSLTNISAETAQLADYAHKLWQTATQFEQTQDQNQKPQGTSPSFNGAQVSNVQNAQSSPTQGSIEAFRKMLLACAQDIRAVIILLASRLQDLRWHTQQKTMPGRTHAHHILHLYAPLANRLGIWPLKWELEDLSFRFLEPQAYRQIATLLDEKRIERQWFIEQMRDKLQNAMAHIGITAEISGRAKHIYSIWKKMHGKNLSFSHLYDVRAFRIIVHEITDCYTALGVVHNLWLPIPKEFDDYISQPKPNGYQSLHTVVIADDGRAIEVQIRTRAMHQAAEFGLAAHWLYKESGSKGYTGQQLANQPYDEKISVLRQLLEWKDESGAVVRQLDKNAWVDDHIYVFTPQAKVIALPLGATVLDFAYHVHTDMGHRCRGARINGKMVPLHTVLENTQTVEIITVKSGGPSRDWLHSAQVYVVSQRAKSKIRAWFNALEMEESVQKGRTILEKILQREGKTAVSLDYIANQLAYKNVQHMLWHLAKDDISHKEIEEILERWDQQRLHQLKTSKNDKPEASFNLKTTQASAPSPKQQDVLIAGVGSLVHQLARCCKPLPGDAIIGFITRGKGVSVHRQNCHVLKQMQAHHQHTQRLIHSDWAEFGSSTKNYSFEILIKAVEHKHLLHDINEVIARQKVKMIQVQTKMRDQHMVIKMLLESTHVDVLQSLLQAIGRIDGVYLAERD